MGSQGNNGQKLAKINDWFANIKMKKDSAPELQEGADDAEKARHAAVE